MFFSIIVSKGSLEMSHVVIASWMTTEVENDQSPIYVGRNYLNTFDNHLVERSNVVWKV